MTLKRNSEVKCSRLLGVCCRIKKCGKSAVFFRTFKTFFRSN